MVRRKGEAPAAGALYKVSLDPSLGHEQRGYRPALVVSPQKYNAKSGLALACPVTSRRKGYPFEVPFAAAGVKGVVLADQVRTLDWRARKFVFAGTLDAEAFEEVRSKLLALIQ